MVNCKTGYDLRAQTEYGFYWYTLYWCSSTSEVIMVSCKTGYDLRAQTEYGFTGTLCTRQDIMTDLGYGEVGAWVPTVLVAYCTNTTQKTYFLCLGEDRQGSKGKLF